MLRIFFLKCVTLYKCQCTSRSHTENFLAMGQIGAQCNPKMKSMGYPKDIPFQPYFPVRVDSKNNFRPKEKG